MKVVVALHVLVIAAAAAEAAVVFRTPALDSAVVRSDREGGNFAYSTVEGHAYAAVSPVVQRVVQPAGVTYQVRQTYYPGFIGSYPVFANPIFGGYPGVGLPAQPAPAAPPQSPPLTGTPVDEDTVAVEAA